MMGKADLLVKRDLLLSFIFINEDRWDNTTYLDTPNNHVLSLSTTL